ncbi:glutamate--tRNA ligase [Candidatus Peribacteria bacterium RIFCSPHIGHO2_01_FULL_51_9]|nr:MAG: glutamate--tRNA ligase [Candidatus Peribacteria bacterium RIFCSPHIGHO2_01_FULL_51_9]
MRTRFAPSPTGFLHVGGLRTALFAYILAKQSGDHFLLRIEDTDQGRSVPGAIENILKSLYWAGITPDEGVILKNGAMTQEGTKGPYIQSERLSTYHRYAEELRQNGFAYPCFCSQERLEQMRKDQVAHKEAPMYDRLCLSLSEADVKKRTAAGEPHVLRLKVPRDEKIVFDDDIRGKVEFKAWTIDDQVLLKSDGFPTYHLAHVVDDHLMDIGIVIRGEEWLSSLPKHLLLFRALGWTPPRYAHLSLILNHDKSKLSKRQGDVAVEDYIQKGYLPEALVNFIALLGWNPDTPQEIFPLKELTERFAIENVQKSGAVFDVDKLNWMQGQWMRKIPEKEFAERIRPSVETHFPSAAHDPLFMKKTSLIHERVTFFSEAPHMLSFFYEEPSVSHELLANAKQRVTKKELPNILSKLLKTLAAIPETEWNEETLKKNIFALSEEGGFSRGQLLWPLRACLTGLPFSPGAFEVAAVLGKEKVLQRVERSKQ